MINFIETLFGVAAVSAIAAVVFLLRRRRSAARRSGLMALAFAALAGVLEIYVRMR